MASMTPSPNSSPMMGRSASSPSIRAAAAQAMEASYVPRRAVQHQFYISETERPRAALKPGQTAVWERDLYSTEHGGQKQSHLQAHIPKGSEYGEMGDQPKPGGFRQQDSLAPPHPYGRTTGNFGTSHWRSEYNAVLNRDAIAGAVYNRQHGPSYQAANPVGCLTSPLIDTSDQEFFGRYGDAPPRSMIKADHSDLPILRNDFKRGTTKGTNHPPGYGGFLPTNTMNPLVAKVEQGVGTRTVGVHLTSENYLSRPPHWAGHRPQEAKNDRGGVQPATLTEYGSQMKELNLRTFAV